MVGRASLKVVLCNTMPIPPVYDVCCELTLSFEVGSDVNEAANTGSPITDTTCGSRGASPSPTRGTSLSSTPKTTHRTMSVSPSVGSTRRTTNYAAGAPDSTVLPVTRVTSSTQERSPTSITTRTSVSVKPNSGHTSDVSPITNKAAGHATDRTILITGGAILLCVTLLAVVLVVTTIVLCVRMRRLTDRFNDQVGNRPESAPPLNTQA
ncbi:hypothetical protein LSAT2_012408 [Lamellibrachia satsuma]|nr:hypothetical protein LSAT2_012408 [Lamellibrachia satsuma]